MERYIGLDVHLSSCTVAVVGPTGKRLGSQVVETNAAALVQVIRGIQDGSRLRAENIGAAPSPRTNTDPRQSRPTSAPG
jgi:hypothetical protein